MPEAVPRTAHGLLAEDNPGDVLLVRQALQRQPFAAELVVRHDREQALVYLENVDTGEVPCPDIVLLDLNLPKRNAEFCLERMRRSRLCSQLPIVIAGSSAFPKDHETAARLGAALISKSLATTKNSCVWEQWFDSCCPKCGNVAPRSGNSVVLQPMACPSIHVVSVNGLMQSTRFSKAWPSALKRSQAFALLTPW